MKIRISDDAVALACGADAVSAAFVAAGAEVERVSSWGMHWLEPLVEIGGIGYGPVGVGDVERILSRHPGVGRDPVPHAQRSEASDDRARLDPGLRRDDEWGSPIADHPFIAKQQRLTFARAGKTRPLSLEDYAATGGWAGLTQARDIGPEATIETVLLSGLRGRGGAGFPAGIKWKTVADTQNPRKYIVCNADEGDSGTFADRMVMEGDPFMLIEGMAIAGLAVGAGKGFVYIRSEYPHAIAKMEAAIKLSAHLVAPFDLEVRVGAGSYVCGEETSLLNSLEGKRGEVRAKPPLPAHEGLFGQPTVINNVLTLAAVPWIMANGGEAYAAFGMGRSKGTLPVQLAGNIKHGGLFETAFGVTLGTLVNDIGGGTASGKPIRAVQVGGPLGAYHHPKQFDLPFDYEAFAAADGLIGHGGVVVFDDSVDMAKQARFAMEFCAVESCGKCTPCRLGSTRGVEVLDALIANRTARPELVEGLSFPSAPIEERKDDPSTSSGRAELLDLVSDLCNTMKFGSLCALGGFTPYPVMSAITHFPEDFE
jgi:formate dehydrogenase iron-sulfur subunit